MQRQTMIALGIALVLGLVAVYLANVFLTGEQLEQRAEARQQAMTKVAVAAVPLDYGVAITPEKVKFVDYPASSLPPGSYSNLSQLLPGGKSRVAIQPILVNEPLLAAKLTGEGEGASLAAVLPDGMRAATVPINAVSGVAGFVQPNSSVDVLITRSLQGPQGNRQATDVLLQDIKVLAIDQNPQSSGDGKANVGSTATLQVDPVNAQKLALAQQVGSLSLVLRRPGQQQDSGMIQTVSLDDLRLGYYGTARPAVAPNRPVPPRVNVASAPRRPVAPAPAPRAAPNNNSNVQVVRGTQSNDYEVGRYGS